MMFLDSILYIYIWSPTELWEKKNVQLRQATPASDFSIIDFPHKGSKYPGSGPNLFFSIILGGGHYFHN